ncbi:ATP-binding protein [uncultured Desulfuromonas sp.]|uniref:PAS domain-containing sensor histidine kinase n=1 Tax=uncultured Desulfuromonas sp. TaxID=181013 RepID=UPI00262E2198|nr:ATP-binding protein [uncultured Desulfuromonas sp.]
MRQIGPGTFAGQSFLENARCLVGQKPGKPGEVLPKNVRDGQFKRILETTTDGVVTLDKTGRYTYANPAAERILGVSHELILQRTFDQTEWKFSTITGAPLPNDETPFKRVLQETKAVYGMKLVIERPDGERIVTSTNAAPLFDADGHFDGIVGVITDVTDQQELLEHNLAFHHTVAHDLRGPLTVIQGHAEMLKEAFRQGKVKGGVVLNVEEILNGAEKMNAMIEDLLDTSRIEGGQVSLEQEPIDLDSFVWPLLQKPQKAITLNRLVTRIPRGLPAVSADPARLERILLNLVSNALKFSPAESKVIIEARKMGCEIIISVIDQGKGIVPEDCSRIFKRFFQVKGHQTSSGVGLGLYICRLLVEGHGGHIWVESKLGEGSTFHFTLPIAAEDIL